MENEENADVTLALRGERVPLRNALSSVYNRSRQELLVATPTALYLYGKMLTAGGDLLATLAVEENVYYQFAVLLPWMDAYSVIATNASGNTEHRIVSSDIKTSLTSHTLLEKDGQVYTALANPHRRELITADTDGGIKVWALRVISTTQNNGGFKGVLRVHTAANSTKKPYYRHLRMSFDGQRIFGATSSKVCVFDAASCSRLPCCLREDRRTIFSIECSDRDNSVYLVFRANMRKICKYSFVVIKGVPQFRRVGTYEHDQDLAVFTENPQYSVDSNSTDNRVLMVDICARFTTANVLDSRQVEPDKSGHSQSAVALPFNPPSERYNALYADIVPYGRNFAFVVWSTGFCVMELFFADAQGRLVCDSIGGEQLKRLGDAEESGTISIYQRLPSAEVAMFKEGDPHFRFAALPTVVDPNKAEEGTAFPIIDYVMAADAIVALWPHGLVEKHNLSDNRFFRIAQPFESAATSACTMINLNFDGQECVAVGDSSGAVCIFPLENNDTEQHSLITRKQAHTSDSVSVLIDLTNKVVSTEVGLSVLSVSRNGEIKHWLIKRPSAPPGNNADQRIVWELLACFRTYSPDVSAATFEFPEFLFCGFGGGCVECWRFPLGPDKPSSKGSRLEQQATQRISVVKRALHAIDLHLAPVLNILSESGAGVSAIANPVPVSDNFSWVFSYDEDAIILVWCFSLDFFFPHRRIKAHAFIKGIYISPSNGHLDLFAYIDRCIDRIDHLGSGDKEAVRLRLRRGREVSAQRDLKSQESGSGQVTLTTGRRSSTRTALRSSAFTPESYDRSRSMMTGAPSVRINITLPVEQKVNMVRKTYAGASPVKSVAEEAKRIHAPSTDKHLDGKDAPDEVSFLQNVLSASPTRMLERLSPKPRSQSPLSRRSPSRHSSRSPRHKKPSKTKPHTRNIVRDVKTKYLPGENSLPSSFQQAKPRIYRKAFNPLDSLSSQARCAVITAGTASSSPSSSEDEDGPELPDTADTQNLVGPTSAIALEFGPQEKVSLVSLVDDEDESILLLDFRPGTRRRKMRRQIGEESHENTKASYKIPFLQWDRLSEHDRRIELMTASKSRCIRDDADKDNVFVPPVEDFESTEISVQQGVRSFTRWFAATHRHHQRIRERFLMEELTFAAIDPFIHQKLANVGLSPPPPEQVLSTKIEFIAWYCLGLTTRSQTIPPEVLLRERLKSRTEYLELRLRMVTQSELEVQEEEERAGPCEEDSEPPQRVFIFEHFVKRLLSDKDSSTSWENTSLENQQKEIMLALMDPTVQIAAMMNDIELPDVSGSCLEDFDILALAGKFLPWWKATRNIHRRDFLKREVHEASTSQAILELLSKDQHSEGGAIDRNGATKDFFEAYFRSDTARQTFLKKKLFYVKRRNRIASVARYGKLPAPLVMETMPIPLVTSFKFVERKVVEEIEPEELIEVVEEEEIPEEPEVVDVEEPQVDFTDNQREQEEEELRRREGENAKITLELIYMAREDALSREYNITFEESDEEVEEPSLIVPKRADFSRSYFFGNLPMHYRKVASSGWRAGSGVDNGDEEYEEEEQLERERDRQRLLDEQEAERLLELERQTERARIEKEREEKAFQFRRRRQVELKKVLVHQAELEAQRKVDIELARESSERVFMQQEDEHSCCHRTQLARDQNEMKLEDQLALQVRKELRDAGVARMRLVLYEQACMFAEDQFSLLVAKEQQESKHQRAVRTSFLSELYTPYRPFYQDSAVASEAFLPRIQWRLQQEQERRTPVRPIGSYTIPLEEALVLDDLDQDPYLARDSRKFKLLMGLPLRTASSQKRPRIPTADAIIAMQRQRSDFDEERQEASIGSGKYASLPQKLAPHSRIQKSSEHSRLPDIVSRTRSVNNSLTNLKETCRKQGADIPIQCKTVKNNQQQQNQQNQSLPFFRGNMLVQGHSQARSKDYAY